LIKVAGFNCVAQREVSFMIQIIKQLGNSWISFILCWN